MDDHVGVVVLDGGSGVLAGAGQRENVWAGDVIVLGPHTAFEYRPASRSRMTVALVDRRLFFDLFSWAYSSSDPNRDRVRLVLRSVARPIEVLHPDRVAVRRVRALLRPLVSATELEAHPLHLIGVVGIVLSALEPSFWANHPAAWHADAERMSIADPRVAEALESMLSLPPREWSVEVFARRAGLSVSSFSRMFSTELGVPPREFIAQRRLREFIRLIESTALPVAEAARIVGWQSPSRAAAAFRHRTGLSPTAYRGELSGRWQVPTVRHTSDSVPDTADPGSLLA